MKEMKEEIRRRVLRGIALNRTPGFHFAGNFLGMELLEVGRRTRVVMEPGPHSTERDGRVHIAPIAMAADIALAASVRAQLSPATRLATVSMQLQFNGAPAVGTLEASGDFSGFIEGAASRQGLSRVTIAAGGREIGFGHGAFMALEPPPGTTMHPVQARRAGAVDLPDERALAASEREILRHADALLEEEADAAFVARFLGGDARKTESGANCRMRNGAHVGNRVGHAQGGILLGFAAAAASVAAGPEWALSAIAAAFVSPGEGDELEGVASVVHRGRWTAAVRVDVSAPGARRVLEVATTHVRRRE